MATADPEQERQRLRELYSAMGDQELLRIAVDAGSLTEEAQEALEDEIERRGLDDELDDLQETGRDELTFEEMVAIRQFPNLPEALLAKGALDSAGIRCALTDDNMTRLAYSNLVGGIKLCVREKDAESALTVLEQPVPDSFDADAVNSYETRRCPKCGSLDSVSAGSNTGTPLIPADSYKCLACGHEWQGSE